MSQQISELADHLNNIIKQAEEKFARRFRARAAITMATEEGVGIDNALEFSNGQFYVTDRCGKSVRLTSCTLEVRTFAVTQFQALWNSCVAAENTIVNKLEQAICTAEEFVAAES